MPAAQPPVIPYGPNEKTKMRVGFFVSFPFHEEILAPIHAELKDEFPCLISSDVEAIIKFRPHVLVIADRFLPKYRARLPDTIVVYTRHGFISKSYAWGVFGEADFVCVSSPWVRDDSARRGWRPQMGFWVTGFTALDEVLTARAIGKHPDLPPGFSSRGPTLLYAPTFNRCMSSIEMLGAGWIRQLQKRWPDLNVIVKPHPHTPTRSPESMAVINEMAASPHTWLVPCDANVYTLMSMADVLISDASSVPFYYLAFDRPIILINNPKRFEEPRFFDPEGPEWVWRDMATQIDDAGALPQALHRCIEHPEELAERRAFYRERIFGEFLDGRAATRIARKLRALAAPSAHDRAWVEIVWNTLRTMSGMKKALATAEPAPVADPAPVAEPAPIVINLDNYPHLRSAVKEQPAMRAEILKVVGRALHERTGKAPFRPKSAGKQNG
jgi:teichoic acid glycerol-phosphate transferase